VRGADALAGCLATVMQHEFSLRGFLSASKSHCFAQTHFQTVRLKSQTIGAAALCVQYLRLKGLAVFKQITLSALLAALLNKQRNIF
jgi:hypothetical protein